MKKFPIIKSIILLVSTIQLNGQCVQNSINPSELEYVSGRQNQMLYYEFSDFIQIKNLPCVDRSKITKISVKAKNNCTVEQIPANFESATIFDKSNYRIKFSAFASCEILLTVNDTLSKTITFYPKNISAPHVDVKGDGSKINFVNVITEDAVIGDPSCGIIYWTAIKYDICIINNGKLLYSGQNIGNEIKPEIKMAINNAPKNSFLIFYNIELESNSSVCFKKETFKFEDCATTKKR